MSDQHDTEMNLVHALEAVAVAGDDIAKMAPHFISTRDEQSLRNYGGNIASIARAALAERMRGHKPDCAINSFRPCTCGRGVGTEGEQ